MIYCDFEYNDTAVILCCILDDTTGAKHEFDIRQPGVRDAFAAFVEAHRSETWASYSAQAEMSSFLRLGVSVAGMDWICLRAEACMISGTHPSFLAYHPGLHDHLAVFQVPVPPDDKGAMRDLILGQTSWSDTEWADITRYCWGDVMCLPALYDSIRCLHEDIERTIWEPDQARLRGDYLVASTTLDHRSQGLPIDGDMLRRIFTHRRAVQAALAVECNAHYGHPIYAKKFDTIEKMPDGSKKVRVRYTLSHEGLEGYLKSLPFDVKWQRTPSGRLSLEDSYLDDLIKDHPQLVQFKHTRNTLSQLNNDGLVELLSDDGYIKPLSLPFYTVTGRNQPMAARGFVLNLPPWLRHVIRPHPGQVLIACDWSKQEIGIAAALSGDERLIEAFKSADIYLELGKMAGAIPQDGTKDSHDLERQAYKSVQLGLGYGMGVRGLAKQLYADMNMGRACPVITKEQAEAKAAEIYAWHKRTFPVYWKFLYSQAEDARTKGYTTTSDGWFYFANSETKMTRLLNFPMQGNGAVMLREAIKMLAAETDLDVVCSLHDAIYVQCAEQDATQAIDTLRSIMRRAVTAVIGEGIAIQVDAKTYTHAEGYIDKRGTKTLRLIEGLLDRLESEGDSLTEIVPKPVRKTKKAKKAKKEILAEDLFKFEEIA